MIVRIYAYNDIAEVTKVSDHTVRRNGKTVYCNIIPYSTTAAQKHVSANILVLVRVVAEPSA